MTISAIYILFPALEKSYMWCVPENLYTNQVNIKVYVC